MSRPRFARVPRTVWDSRLRSLSPGAQAVFFGLLTGPFASSVPGVVPVGAAAIAELVGCSTEAARSAFCELESAGLIKVDASALLVWLPDGPVWDPPSNRNVVTGWINQWPNLPKSPLLEDVRSALLKVVPRDLERQALEEATLSKPFPIGSGTHPKHVRTPPPSPSPSPSSDSSAPVFDRSKPAPLALVPIDTPRAEVVITFPAVGPGPKAWNLTELQRKELALAFPAVDVLAEARKALAWINANPTKRKTAGGYLRFLTSWLIRTNDRPGGAPGPGPRPYRGVDLSAAGGDE